MLLPNPHDGRHHRLQRLPADIGDAFTGNAQPWEALHRYFDNKQQGLSERETFVRPGPVRSYQVSLSVESTFPSG